MQAYIWFVVALAAVFTVLGVTASLSHVSEHILIAAAIGYGTLFLLLVPLQKVVLNKTGTFCVVAWWSGTMYYLGREVRDYEKGSSGSFDWGGFLGPAFGNIVTFALTYAFYEAWKSRKDLKKLEEGTELDEKTGNAPAFSMNYLIF